MDNVILKYSYNNLIANMAFILKMLSRFRNRYNQ